MEEEAIYILTKLKLMNHQNLKGKYIKLTYNELLDYTIKAIKILEEANYGRTNSKN